MIDAGPASDSEISLFTLGTRMLRSRWRIARWMLIGAVLGSLAVATKPKVYTATASFIPQGFDAGRSGLAGLIGQFGVSLPTSNQSLSPDFYSQLLRSRVLLEPIARGSFVVEEMGHRSVPFLTLFKVNGGSKASRVEEGVRELSAMIVPTVMKTTGVVQVSIATEWPSVSLAIVKALLNGVTTYNQQTRQGLAADEERFVQARLLEATSELRASEDRLQNFLQNNRMIGSSAELAFERDRLQRDVALRQQLYTTLMQAYEDARIREVRDTPVVTVFEPPAVAAMPEPRGRLKTILLSLMLGGLVGSVLALISGARASRRPGINPEADEFAGTLAETKREMLQLIPGLGKRARS